MITTLVRAGRLLTAAAAAFALLGACGIPINHGQPIRRPRPLPPMSTIRSLTGAWDGTVVAATEPGPRVTLTLRQRGLQVTGTLVADGRVVHTVDDPPAEVDTYGRIALRFGHGTEQVGLRLLVDTTGDRMTGSVTGLAPATRGVTFVRR